MLFTGSILLIKQYYSKYKIYKIMGLGRDWNPIPYLSPSLKQNKQKPNTDLP